jgi:hypothetical protein
MIEDLAEIVELITQTYAVESDNWGVDLRNDPRYPTLKEAEPDLNYFYIIKNDVGGQGIIGVIRAKLIQNNTIVDIGPYAVKT